MRLPITIGIWDKGHGFVKQQADLTQLGRIFERYPDIQAVYLFGSRAGGAVHAESDLDLAILARHPRLRSQKLDILMDLARHGFCNVDLLFLDGADIVTSYEAIRMNWLVYAVEDFDSGALYSDVVRRYLDFLPYLRVQRAAYKRSILGDQA